MSLLPHRARAPQPADGRLAWMRAAAISLATVEAGTLRLTILEEGPTQGSAAVRGGAVVAQQRVVAA
jgi:hypothetical protein